MKIINFLIKISLHSLLVGAIMAIFKITLITPLEDILFAIVSIGSLYGFCYIIKFRWEV